MKKYDNLLLYFIEEVYKQCDSRMIDKSFIYLCNNLDDVKMTQDSQHILMRKI
jgi:hypothetical protein